MLFTFSIDLYDALRCDRASSVGKEECLQLLNDMNNGSVPLIVLAQVTESIWAEVMKRCVNSDHRNREEAKLTERYFVEFFSLVDIEAGMTIAL